MKVTLLFFAVLLALITLTAPNASAQKAAHFPSAKGNNLEGKSFSLPHDLGGELNIVIVAFEREQQSDIGTWIPAAQNVCAMSPYFRYYEIPVIQKTTGAAEKFINQGMARGIAAKEDRERTITLYTDKARFMSELEIENAASIYVFLTDRRGEIVWRGEGKQTPDKAAALTKAAQDWLQTKEPKIETLSGPTAALSDFHGKAVVLIMSGQGPAKAAGLLLQEIVVDSAQNPDYMYAAVADLSGVPGMLRGTIRDGIKSSAKQDNARLIAALKDKGIIYDSRSEPITFLDWQSVLIRNFDAAGKTGSAYQVFVLNRAGKTVFHYAQDKNDKSAPSPAPQILKALQEAAAPLSAH